MNQDETAKSRRFYPIEIDVRNTIGFAMGESLTYAHPQVPNGAWEFQDTRELTEKDYRGMFQDVDAMDFRWKASAKESLPDIPFDEIGLMHNLDRDQLPETSKYRPLVREHFEGRASCNRRAKYDFDAVNQTIYWNSGKELRALSR